MRFVALRRLALRILYPLSKLGARFGRRPAPGGSVAVIWKGRVLVVRHSYRPGWALPGGRARAREDPRTAALRELREEVGIEAPPDRVEAVYQDLWTRIFEYRPEREPAVRVDAVEVVHAEFRDPASLENPTGPLRDYLLCRGWTLR